MRGRLGRADPFGNVHPPHGRCPVRAGLGPVQERLEVAPQIRFVVRGCLSVHAHGPVLARAPVGLVEPRQVEVVVQGGECLLRSLPREFSYPLLSR